MKKYFYIFIIAIISVAGFFVFTNARAQQQAIFASAQAKSCATAITNSSQGEDYCNSQKKCSMSDLKTKLIPGEASLSAQNPCRGLAQEDIDAIVKIFQESGWLSDAPAVTEPKCAVIRDIPLDKCVTTAISTQKILKVDGVDRCCSIESPVTIDKKQKEQQQRLCEATGAYDYKGGTGGKIDITSKNIREGMNLLNLPKSPLGTSLLEEKDGSPSITIPKLIKYIYEWLISLGGFAAFIALVIAGVQYLTSAGNPGKMSEAIARIRSAGIGLVLLLSSVLILNTINPRLINIGIDPGKLQDAPAPIFKEKVGSVLSYLYNKGFECGAPCQEVWFCSEPNSGGNCKEVKVGQGKTVTGELSDTEKENIRSVRSVKFLPETPAAGDCSVTMYQLPLIKPATEEKPPFQPITTPAPDIGGVQGGFPMKSYEVSDASGASAVEFDF